MAVNIKKDFGRRKPDLNTMVFGKIPPQAPEFEEDVLGAIMLEKDLMDMVIEILPSADCFYVDAHQKIFGAMLTMTKAGTPIDLLTTMEYLNKVSELEIVGGAYYLTKLTSAVVSAAHVEAHARIIKEKYLMREMIRIGGATVGDAYSDETDVFDLMERLHGEVYDLSTQQVKKDYQQIGKVVMENQKNMDIQRNSAEDFTGVPTGFKDIDHLTKGWQKTDLIILAARPAVGKTAFALNLAMNAATHSVKPFPIAIFSLEMSSEQLEKRLRANHATIELSKVIHPKLMSEAEYEIAIRKGNEIAQMPIYIDDSAGISIFEMKSKARRMKKLHGIELIIVDYLQLMKGDRSKNSNREQEISSISRELKILAKELEVPVIALSQLNRGVEARQDNKPKLSDLRESGAIEQDADIVCFLYRPSDEEVKQDATLTNMAYIDFQKHRNGSIDKIPLTFYGKYQRWQDMKEYDPFDNTPPDNPNAGMPTRLPEDDTVPF